MDDQTPKPQEGTVTRRTVTVQVTAEIDDDDPDFAARLADAAEHAAGAYWATATLED